MQKLQVYGHRRLPSMGMILIVGAFLRVGSINCQRSRTPGRLFGCCLVSSTFHTCGFAAALSRGSRSAVPEPSSIVLCGIGMLAVCGFRSSKPHSRLPRVSKHLLDVYR